MEEEYDKDLILQEFFEKYGYPENWDNWPSLWKSCYEDGVYIGIVVERRNNGTKR